MSADVRTIASPLRARGPLFAAALLALAIPAPAAAQAPGLAIDPPEGWATSLEPDGSRAILARDSADLAAGLPAGPRIRIAGGAGETSLPEPEVDRVVEDPSETTLGDRTAVSIGLESDGVRRRVIVTSAGGASWRIDLEAPAATWDAAVASMEPALASLKVGGAGPIALGPTADVAVVASAGPAVTGAPAAAGGGSVRRRGLDGGVIALGALAFVALGLLGALLVTRRGGLTGRAGSALRLEVVDPGGGVREAAVRSLPALIGRDPDCDVVLADPEASRRHARLVEDADGVVVEDLGSRAGILVDGRPVRAARVAGGSEILLGKTRVRVR